MKRILSLLCCFFLSLLAIAPLNEAEAVSKGKIVFVGTLKELKDKYDKKDLEKLFMEVIKND